MIKYSTIQIMPKQEELEELWQLKNGGQIIASAQSLTGNRDKNDDYYGVFLNKFDHNLILSVICDGVGWYSHSEKASEYVVKKLGDLFRGTKAEIINNTDKFMKILNEVIYYINENLPFGATTLTATIINNEGIIIAHTGDSRAYGIKNLEVTQLTEDESEVWEAYQKGYLEKDDLRFLRGNNVIFNALDGTNQIKINYKLIKGHPYNALLLTTDGIHDILSDKKMNKILKISEIEEIVPNLLKEAVYGKPEKLDSSLEEKIYEAFYTPYYSLNPGKDNTTAVLTLMPKKTK